MQDKKGKKTMMYFVKNLTLYAAKNTAYKELRDFIAKYEYVLIKDQCSLDALRCVIETAINNINAAHPKLRPIRYSWNESLMRIDASIKSGSGVPDVVFFMDICIVRSTFQYSEEHSINEKILQENTHTTGICCICGCTEKDPCFHPEHGTCWWANEERTLCSHCADPKIARDLDTVHCIKTKGI